MKVKDYYNADCAKLLSQKIKTVFPDFNEKVFIKYVDKNVSDKEFSERMDVFVDAFELYLPENYENNIKIFEQILGSELKQETGMFTEGWWLWPIGRYVERHGIKNVKISLDFIKELTKRFTGEYAIRPLLANKPKETIKTMEKWSKDGNVHVRRLASEGVRISLPWSKKIYIAIEEFEIYKKILTNLKNDKSKFVQKSVGNNLNDLYKEFPEKANEIINEWKKDNPTKETIWIINHGLRSIKKNKIMEYGQTAYNRIVYAAPAVAGLAYEKTQSAYGLCAFFLRHIFAVAGNLRFPLSQPQKRRIHSPPRLFDYSQVGLIEIIYYSIRN